MLGAIDAGKKVMEVGSKLVDTQKKLKQVIDNVDALVPMLESIQSDIQDIKETQKFQQEVLKKIEASGKSDDEKL